jgi:cob(I)alamin adenosyltransferase
LIHLYTGDGKGKTTAAVGQAVRAAGSGYKVFFSQFMKGNDTGEICTMSKIPEIKISRSHKNFGFYSGMSDADKAELTDIHNKILEDIILNVEENKVFMIIMDELTYPVKWGLIDIDRLKYLLELTSGKESGAPEIVITGRDAADFIMNAADYVTEMKSVRHPFDDGVNARRGIEY